MGNSIVIGNSAVTVSKDPLIRNISFVGIQGYNISRAANTGAGGEIHIVREAGVIINSNVRAQRSIDAAGIGDRVRGIREVEP